MRLNTYIKDEQEIYEVRAAMRAIVRKAVFNTLVYEGFDKNCEVSVTFVDNEAIKTLNSSYRNKDSETDVLSFPMFDNFDYIDMGNEDIPLGDIVISLERAAKQGYEIGHSIYHEVAFFACIQHFIYLAMTMRPQRKMKRKCSENKKK